MTVTETEIQSQLIGLSAEAFKAFCNDVSAMFGVSMKCDQQKSCTETVEGPKKHFQELVAVILVKAEGALNGIFQLILDKQGLFILGNLMTMPERIASMMERVVGSQKIAKNVKSGSLKEAKELSDAVTEAGNLMVGSWDKVFREELDKHEHFTQISTFIGNPWNKPEENMGFAPDEELLFVLYKMTAASYPAFTCGVIFPKAVFSDAEAEKKIRAEARAKVLAEAREKAKAEAKSKPSEAEIKARIEAEERAKVEAEMKAEAQAKEKAVETKDKTAEEPVETKQKASGENKTETKEPVVEEATGVETEPKETSELTEPTNGIEPAAGSVSETIQRMTQSPAELPVDISSISLAISAKDIMQKEVGWITLEDSVQNALTKAQQVYNGYLLVGTNGVLEGILSKSDIVGAVSIYLRPIFAKWRRPIDDATLNIRVKWIMTRPVHTIKPDTSLAAIIENMSRFGGKCMPVIDQQNKVAGLVTVFDIFKALLTSNQNVSLIGKSLQVPSLA